MKNIKVSYRQKIKTACDLDFSEHTAAELWKKTQKHRNNMSRQLGRDVEIRVALLDFLSTQNFKIDHLMLVSRERYREAWTNAYRDPLTKLYNRRYLLEFMKKEIEKSKRYHLSFSLCFIDLDHFKAINDRYGHIIGAMVLEKSAKLIQKISRESDLVARFGGEEFVLLMPQTSGQMAYKVAERIRLAFHQNNIEDPIFSGVTMSGGVLTCPHDADNLTQILEYADQALYEAKGRGRDRIIRYKQNMKKRLIA